MGMQEMRWERQAATDPSSIYRTAIFPLQRCHGRDLVGKTRQPVFDIKFRQQKGRLWGGLRKTSSTGGEEHENDVRKLHVYFPRNSNLPSEGCDDGEFEL